MKLLRIGLMGIIRSIYMSEKGDLKHKLSELEMSPPTNSIRNNGEWVNTLDD